MTDVNVINSPRNSVSPRATSLSGSTKNDKALRIKYYSTIKASGDFNKSFIHPPPHVLNENIFIINQQFSEEPRVKKNSSIITIFSVWNTMIGSSLVSMPYYTRHAGIIPTICKFEICLFDI